MKNFFFGSYPQTKKAAAVSVGTKQDSRGYWLGGDGGFYEKVGSEYYKVEPIVWEIQEERDGRILLLSRDIIDAREYDGESNHYARSEIRGWLNGAFLQKAFTAEEQRRVAVTSVRNGSDSVAEEDNEYICEDTRDKIFLPSVRELARLGREDRKRPVSDYARAQGASKVEKPDCLKDGRGCGWWLSRSPNALDENIVDIVDADGSFTFAPVDDEAYGIAPALFLL